MTSSSSILARSLWRRASDSEVRAGSPCSVRARSCVPASSRAGGQAERLAPAARRRRHGPSPCDVVHLGAGAHELVVEQSGLSAGGRRSQRGSGRWLRAWAIWLEQVPMACRSSRRSWRSGAALRHTSGGRWSRVDCRRCFSNRPKPLGTDFPDYQGPQARRPRGLRPRITDQRGPVRKIRQKLKPV